MTREPNGVSEPNADAPAGAPAALSATRPFYWSVRRELWESRSLHVAPLIAAAIALFGLSIRAVVLVDRMRTVGALEPSAQRTALATPYSMAAMMIMVTTLIVGAFYSLEALYGERRDRSLLFWKSLPVSDLTTVLSKAAIPLAVLPVQAFLIVLATQLLLLLGLTVHAFWHAPIYGWLLLVSAWARRAPFLWLVLPPLALIAVERMAFGTSYFGSLVRYRLAGAMREAFALKAQKGHVVIIDRLEQLDPGRFLSAPGLWVGLALAAAFLLAAARLRRNREPI
jgi:ABC-2 type transport system permease protein